MTFLKIRDANGDIKNLAVNGSGTEGDPYIPIRAEGIEESVHKNAAIQDTTAGVNIWTPASGKKVLINSVVMTFSASTAQDDGKAKLQAYIGGSWVDMIVLAAKKNTNEVVSHTFKHHIATDVGTGNPVLRVVVTGSGAGQETSVTVEGEETT